MTSIVDCRQVLIARVWEVGWVRKVDGGARKQRYQTTKQTNWNKSLNTNSISIKIFAKSHCVAAVLLWFGKFRLGHQALVPAGSNCDWHMYANIFSTHISFYFRCSKPSGECIERWEGRVGEAYKPCKMLRLPQRSVSRCGFPSHQSFFRKWAVSEPSRRALCALGGNQNTAM